MNSVPINLDHGRGAVFTFHPLVYLGFVFYYAPDPTPPPHNPNPVYARYIISETMEDDLVIKRIGQFGKFQARQSIYGKRVSLDPIRTGIFLLP